MEGDMERADLLAQDDAELDAFVADLFKGGDELKISSVAGPSSNLIPTIVRAFKVRSALVNFRPLSMDFRDATPKLYRIWRDAAEKRFRPCPFCARAVDQNDASVTDRYHIRNDDSGQQLTVEVSEECIRQDEAYEEPGKYWIRSSYTDYVRIFVDDEVRCRPELPMRPQRVLLLPHQEDLLLEVFGFASRDDLDSSQLTRKFWRDTVNNAAGTLALRPLHRVCIDWLRVIIQRAPVSETMPGASFDALWDSIPSYRYEEFRLEGVPIVVSLLRHGCVLRCVVSTWEMDHFSPISQHLADAGRTFRAKSVVLDCYDEQEIISPLQLVAGMGTKEFDLQVHFPEAAHLIFGNEVLLGVKRFRLQIGAVDYDYAITGPELSDIQEHCHEYLRRALGCHVSLLQYGSYALFSCDHVIERFLAASRRDDFTMPLSIQMRVLSASTASLELTSCKHSTLSDVAIPHKVLPLDDGITDRPRKFDVYHFRNERIDEWLTVCLGKDPRGIVGYVFLQKGRIMMSEEDITEMEPFSYQ